MTNTELIRQEIERRLRQEYEILWNAKLTGRNYPPSVDVNLLTLTSLRDFIDSLQQEQQMPDSTQLIAEWEREKAVLEQKDFRGDAERMAYNAFLDGFVKGLGYEGTK